MKGQPKTGTQQDPWQTGGSESEVNRRAREVRKKGRKGEGEMR
jgi:hypothetical protein